MAVRQWAKDGEWEDKCSLQPHFITHHPSSIFIVWIFHWHVQFVEWINTSRCSIGYCENSNDYSSELIPRKRNRENCVAPAFLPRWSSISLFTLWIVFSRFISSFPLFYGLKAIHLDELFKCHTICESICPTLLDDVP